MASTKTSRQAPPSLPEAKSYDDWLKLLKIWRRITDVEKSKQGSTLLLSLKGETQEAALQVSEDDIVKDDGIDYIIKELDKLYKKDDTLKKFEILDSFESYRRPTHVTIKQYIIEFEKRKSKAETAGAQWSDDILAYRLIKNANLTEANQQMIKATLSSLTYKPTLDKLKAIYGDSSNPPDTPVGTVKIEEINYGDYQDDYDEYNNEMENQELPLNNEMTNASELDQDVFFTRNNEQSQWRRPYYNSNSNRRFHNNRNYNSGMNSRATSNRNMYQRGSTNVRFSRAGSSQSHNTTQRRGRNPLDSNGQQSKCTICQSINHWAQQCPDANIRPVLFQEHEEVTLFEGDLDHPQKLKSLVAETLCAAVLDCGASKTCCGTTWWNDYIQTLDQSDTDKIDFQPSNKVFQFGGGDRYESLSRASFPASIGGRPLTITADIISADIPLLLSKDSLKKAGASIDFSNDTAHILNETVELIPTKSGHYAIPITPSKQLLNEMS